MKKGILIADGLFLFLCLFADKIATFMFKTGLADCQWRDLGVVCPGCGGTRCVYNFALGNFEEAFTFHPFIFCLIIYGVIVLILCNLGWLLNLNWAQKTVKVIADYRFLLVLAFLFPIFGLSRNFFCRDLFF